MMLFSVDRTAKGTLVSDFTAKDGVRRFKLTCVQLVVRYRKTSQGEVLELTTLGFVGSLDFYLNLYWICKRSPAPIEGEAFLQSYRFCGISVSGMFRVIRLINWTWPSVCLVPERCLFTLSLQVCESIPRFVGSLGVMVGNPRSDPPGVFREGRVFGFSLLRFCARNNVRGLN